MTDASTPNSVPPPTLPLLERRLHVRLTDAQEDFLWAMAKQYKTTRSAVVRHLVCREIDRLAQLSAMVPEP